MARAAFAPQALACMVIFGLLVANVAPAMAQSDTFKRCQNAYNAAGGDKAIGTSAPACVGDRSKQGWLQACCNEAKKSLLTGPFAKCLCDKDVYKWVEGRLASGAAQGLTPTMFGAFLVSCGIPSARAGC